MYTPKTVSEMLNIPTSTLRRYASDFSNMLSNTARAPGKKRQYSDTDILILRKIRELTSKHLEPEQIRAALQVIEPEPEHSSALALLPSVLHEFESLRRVISEQSEKIKSLEERITELETPWYKRLFTKPK